MPRFLVLMYHMVAQPRSAEESRYACPPALFARHMEFLRSRFVPLGLELLERHLTGEAELPENAVFVTFDDGFADNFLEALPILERQRIPATVFLTTGVLGGANRWMTERGFPERPMLSWDQVRQMQEAGVSFGGHTVSHPRLPELSAAEEAREIAACKGSIEEQLGGTVSSFAYPFGLYSDRTRGALREAGYTLGFSTRPGFNGRDLDPLAIRRIEVCGTDPVWKLSQKLTFGDNQASLLRPVQYYLQRVKARIFPG